MPSAHSSPAGDNLPEPLLPEESQGPVRGQSKGLLRSFLGMSTASGSPRKVLELSQPLWRSHCSDSPPELLVSLFSPRSFLPLQNAMFQGLPNNVSDKHLE